MEDRVASASPPAPPSTGHREGYLRLYVTVLALVAVAGVSWAFVGLAREPAGWASSATFATLGVLGALFIVLQRKGFTVKWRRHTNLICLDEAIVFVGLLALPAHLVVVTIALGEVVAQALAGRRFLKSAFNTSSHVVSAAASTQLFLTLTGPLGVAPLVAALPAAATYGVITNLFVSGIFATMERMNPVTVFRDRFAVASALNAVIGTATGLTLVALWSVHPVAVVAVAPFIYFTRGYMTLAARADRELAVHRRLANATTDLVGTPVIETAVARVLTSCEDIFRCGRATLVIHTRGDAAEQVWSRESEGGIAPWSTPIRAALPGRDGHAVGELALWPSRRTAESFGDLERELLKVTAAHAAAVVENVHALRAVQTSRERLHAFLMSAKDAVLVVDPSGNLEYANAAGRHLFGLGLGDVGTVRASDLIDGIPLASGGADIQLVEADARDLAGENRFVVEISAAPLVEHGRTVGILVVARDVTEKKRAEQDLDAARRQAVMNEKLSALGTLVAGVAHEINNPLSFMKAATELSRGSLEAELSRDGVPPETLRTLGDAVVDLGVALEGIERIANITLSLKQVSRAGNGTLAPEDVGAIADSVLTVAASRIGPSVEVRREYGAANRALVNGSEISQVLLNLVLNAADAMGHRPGTLVVRTRDGSDRVIVEVEDTGAGIAPEDRHKVFTPFFTTKSQGTGLGLSVSYNIVQSHGGRLDFESEPGRGTIFRVELPMADAPVTAAAPARATWDE